MSRMSKKCYLQTKSYILCLPNSTCFTKKKLSLPPLFVKATELCTTLVHKQ